jgi:hypothetical protein
MAGWFICDDDEWEAAEQAGFLEVEFIDGPAV